MEHPGRRFTVLVTAACVALVPWTIALAITLPRHYLASHWRLAWVGLDVVTIVFLARTAWLAHRRRHSLVISAIVTATLLGVDAWFDVLTASGTSDRLVSLATAVFGEIPLAVLLYVVAGRALRRAGLRPTGPAKTADADPARLSQRPLTESTADPP